MPYTLGRFTRNSTYDAVSRTLPLAKVAGIDRRWALALDAFLAAKGLRVDLQSPNDIVAGPRHDSHDGRRGAHHPDSLSAFPEQAGFPQVSIAELDRPGAGAAVRAKAVFVGETVQARDSWTTPYSNSKLTPGIEINASLYETLAGGSFLVDASSLAVVAAAFALSLAHEPDLWLGFGLDLEPLAACLVVVSQAIPMFAFAHSVVWPWLPGTFAAIFSVAIAATSRHFMVRRDLVRPSASARAISRRCSS